MKSRWMIACLLTATQTAQAQHHSGADMKTQATAEGRSRLEAGHYYGASVSLPQTATWNASHVAQCYTAEDADAVAEGLMAAYWLMEPDTELRIGQWLKAHPLHPLASRLALMQANLLVRQGRVGEALRLYSSWNQDKLPKTERVEARLYEAVACIETNQLQRAEQLLESIQHEDTHGMDVQYYLGYVHYAQGHYREALAPLAAASASYDYGRVAPVYIADCQVQTGQPVEALQTLQQWRRQQGATSLAAEADRVEGEACYGLQQYSRAIPLLSRYVQSSAEPTRTSLYKLGMSQLQMEDYASAALHLSHSAGTVTDAMSQNAWLHAGIAYERNGQKQRASMAFQQAADSDFDRSVQEEALYNYALSLHEGNGMGFGESVTVFERFLNTFPGSRHQAAVNQHLTEVYLSTRNYQAALASINRIQHPDAAMLDTKRQVLYHLGAEKCVEGDYWAAKNYLAQSLMLGPSVDARYWKGEAEFRMGEYAQAEADYRQGLSGQYSLQSSYGLGYALFKQKKYAAAAPAFQHAVNMATEPTLKADALSRLADCQFAARNYDEAYANYQRAIDSDRPHADYALLQQAQIQGLKGNYARKVELLSQIDTQGGSSQYGADALYEQARAYVQSGQSAQAISTFQTLQQRYPQSLQARKAINEQAMLLYAAGKTDEAVDNYRSVIERYPNTAEAQTALAGLKDIYTTQGRVQEYAALATQAGRALSAEELDAMTADAAVRATAAGQQAQALTFYRQLEAQTQNGQMRQTAQVGQLRAAQAMQDYKAVEQAASRIIDNAHAAADIADEARLLRAQARMAQGDSKGAVADYQVLSQAVRTVHGAQAVVELAQYAYDTQQYQSAEQVLTPFIDSGTNHTYWLARAFVLLADIYNKTGRSVEARQYLLSLRSNYTESDEINQMIQERLK